MHRGVKADWLNRVNMKHLDSALLYQSFPVCDCCYWIYEYTDKLREIEFKFAQKLGIPVAPHLQGVLVSILNLKGGGGGS